MAGRRVLLPRAAVARDLVPAELCARGAHVDVVEAYRTVAPEGLAERTRAVFGGPRKPDFVTFTSSSTVQNLVASLDAELLPAIKGASIGPITSRTARESSIEIIVEANPYTADGLVEALLVAATAQPSVPPVTKS